MFDNKTAYDAANIYTNFQGLESLRYDYKAHPDVVKKEVSEQFESLLVQILLKSMRDANKGFESDLIHSDQSAFYEDMFDKQLTLVLSKSGMGLAKTIQDFIDRAQTNNDATAVPSPDSVSEEKKQLLLGQPVRDDKQADMDLNQPSKLKQETTNALLPVSLSGKSGLFQPDGGDAVIPFENMTDFIKTLWSSAKEAAHLIGVDPKLLLAQAALETNWGKNIIPQEGGGSTHNLFNIKADSSWRNKSASFTTVEQRDSVLVKESSKFRSYNSFSDSFIDYAAFLKQNNRYTDALKNASDPTKFVQSLQDANYATDTLYSEKIMDIFSSSKFNRVFEHFNLT